MLNHYQCSWSLKMEPNESKSPTQTEDSSVISITIEETIEEFQDCVKDMFEKLEKDEKFSQMSAKSYDKKKCYLRKHLDELSRLHTLLADRYIHLNEEVSNNCPYLIHPSDSSVKDDALKVKDTNTEESHLEVNEAAVIFESDLKIKTLEEELEKYKKKLSIADDMIKNLKGEPSSNLFQENQKLKHELDLKQNQVNMAAEYVTSKDREIHELEEKMNTSVVEVRKSDAKFKKLKSKNDGYKSEIKRLEEILESKERICNKKVAKLKLQLKNQTKSFNEMKKQLNISRSERSTINIKLDTFKEEKKFKDKLIQELETRLNALQVEHERVVSSFEDAKKIHNERVLKVVAHAEGLSVASNKILKVLGQFIISREHSLSKYKRLPQLSGASDTRRFDFLTGFNTQ